MTAESTADDAPLVVACTLDRAGHETQSRRWRELREHAELRQLKTRRGKRLYFRADEGVLEELQELTAIENQCCSWALWAVDPQKSEIVLHVTSTGYGVDVIHQMFEGSQHTGAVACCDDCG
jgi:hypothetical protein